MHHSQLLALHRFFVRLTTIFVAIIVLRGPFRVLRSQILLQWHPNPVFYWRLQHNLFLFLVHSSRLRHHFPCLMIVRRALLFLPLQTLLFPLHPPPQRLSWLMLLVAFHRFLLCYRSWPCRFGSCLIRFYQCYTSWAFTDLQSVCHFHFSCSHAVVALFDAGGADSARLLRQLVVTKTQRGAATHKLAKVMCRLYKVESEKDKLRSEIDLF